MLYMQCMSCNTRTFTVRGTVLSIVIRKANSGEFTMPQVSVLPAPPTQTPSKAGQTATSELDDMVSRFEESNAAERKVGNKKEEEEEEARDEETEMEKLDRIPIRFP